MSARTYDRRQAARLLPLLRSLAVELQERATSLRRLEWMRKAFATSERAHRAELDELCADIACNRYGLRRAQLEIEGLGCSLEDMEPVVIRIPAETGKRGDTFTWRPDQPYLLLRAADSAA